MSTTSLAMTWPALDLAVRPPLRPMEAELAGSVPLGAGWLYEPKWDGFRCVAFKDGTKVALQSKAGQPLGRYFPEIVEAVAALAAPRAVLDGELVVRAPGGFAFEQLVTRIHPAASRIRRGVEESPAAFLAFDLLLEPGGASLIGRRLELRRAALEALARGSFDETRIALSPATRDRAEAQRWLGGRIAGIDGVVAKRLDAPYAPGVRAARKVKRLHTADCVVGGFRWAAGKSDARTREIASLLLGLYGDDGRLHYVGHAANFDARTREALTTLFLPLANGIGFTGEPPRVGTSSRGSDWVAVRPDRVVEVEFHRATDRRLRQGARLVRTRPDKDPRTCTFEQLAAPRQAEPTR